MIRDMRIRTAARGSGAGSLTNYLLGISGVDPIEHELLFERFLSTERTSLPDIDIDVESARRHDIYRAIFKRFGDKRVTLLSMQSTYRGRGAMRDSGLALGLDDNQIDEIAKSMWRFSARSFRNALSVKPELAEFAEAVEQDRKMNLLVDLTERLDRIPRHISMHPCGVILGDLPLPHGHTGGAHSTRLAKNGALESTTTLTNRNVNAIAVKNQIRAKQRLKKLTTMTHQS